MNFGWIYSRDSILVDENFQWKVNEALRTNKVPPRSTILLAARDFKVKDGYTFELIGHDLIVLADTLDGGAIGTISLGTIDAGNPGYELTVFCRQLMGIHLRSKGGRGYAGKPGRPGRPGKPGISRPNKPGGSGGPGGAGGEGSPGGQGARGGDVKIIFIEDKVSGGFNSAASIDVPGGDGGEGGDGGSGGPGGPGGDGVPPGEDGPDGPNGPKGRNGEPGPPGSKEAKQLSENDYYKEIHPFVAEWSAYRLRLGQYYFRAFRPARDPKRPTLPENYFLEKAMAEFTEILKLDPQNEQAAIYRNSIVHNENILGLARDIDIIPDFEHYQSIARDYGPMVLSLFQTATNLLMEEISMDQKQQDLDREIAHIQGQLEVLRAEESEAQLGVAVIQAEERLMNNRLNAIRQSIAEKDEELRNKTADIGGTLFTFAQIGVAVVGVATGTSALVSAIPAVVKLSGIVKEKDVVTLITDNDLKKKYEEDAKGLGELIPKIERGADALISFPKMLDELIAIPDVDSEYRELMKETTEITHQKKLVQMRKTQAEAALNVVRKKMALAQNDLDLAKQQRAGLIADIEYLKQVAINLIRSAQRYMDILIKYAFFAARALEIYTYEDKSSDIRYDYGYIHPDTEEDLILNPTIERDGRKRSSFIPLIEQYVNSWKQFVDILLLQDSYEKYISSGDQVGDIHFISFTDQQILSQFKQTANLFFVVDLKDLPQSRYEAKVKSVHIYLENVKSNAPAITLIVEHSGIYKAKLREDDNIIQVVLKPHRATALSARDPPNFGGETLGDSPKELSFWGRGVATSWHIYIEQDEIASKQIDLSQLSKIEVSISYRSFLVQH
jgi:hypothetical protein